MSLFGVIRDAITGKTASVTDDNKLMVEIPPLVSSANSTSTPLLAGVTFEGDAEEINGYGIIYVNTYSDQVSAIDGLEIQQSSDGVNWDHCDEFTIPAAKGKNFSINPYAKYVRVRYTNGDEDQTEFRLQTIFKADGLSSSHRIQDSIIDDDDASLVKAVLTAKQDGDGFANINSTASGNLKTTDAESGLAIAKGDVAGTSFIHKFGNAPSFSTGDGIVTIWDAADGSGSAQYQYNYSTTADIDSISSSDAGDTQIIEIQGIDADYNLVIQTITLTGQATQILATPLLRVFRMKNNNSANLAGNVFLYINGAAVVNGVPSVPSTIRAGIETPNNQTLMAIYTVPAGKTAYMRDWYAATAAGNKNATYKIVLKARPQGGVFQTKHVSSISDIGTNAYQHKYEEPEVFAEKTDIEMTVQLLSTGVSGASISAGFDVVLIDN
jgi:hypothetical protein